MSKLKQTTTPVQTIKVNKTEIMFYLDHDQHPIVISSGNTHRSLHHLIQSMPELSNPDYLSQLAHLINFFSQGTDYHVIDDIPKFQEAYLERIEYEKNSFDYMPLRIIDHGIFDVRVMHPPRVINRELIFFVQQDHTQLPYRVSCSYPIEREKLDTRYQLLPYAM
jgi:hypothetical protein